MKTQAIQGFKDILPDEMHRWLRIENVSRDIFQRFGFREIRLPIMEETSLFARSIGQDTDIVEKEMYTFADKGATLRPEATASLLRAFIEHALHLKQPVQRLFTIGPMFRHERPQKGRLRQFHQLDAEVIGAKEPDVDSELMAMGAMILTELGLAASLEINSLGCPRCRPSFREQLIDYLRQYSKDLCPDCRRRTDTNPLRVLDCKKSNCRELVDDAPSILASLCAACEDHFNAVCAGLERLGVSYTLNRFMVRGLDYYTRTTFEFLTDNLGAQAAIGAGGRYDGLIEQLGGPALPGIGFALGMERLALLMEQNEEEKAADSMDLYIAALGERAIREGQVLAHHLRSLGVRTGIDYGGRSLKAQMKQAGRVRARFALIIGDDELDRKAAQLRDMTGKDQQEVSLAGDAPQAARTIHTIISSAPA